jgi:hypothetical protein
VNLVIYPITRLPDSELPKLPDYQILLVSRLAYIVIENLITTEMKPWRVPAVFVFGAVHGAAFGIAAKALGLTRAELPPALAWLTAGIEGGQLTVLGLALILLYAGSNHLRLATAVRRSTAKADRTRACNEASPQRGSPETCFISHDFGLRRWLGERERDDLGLKTSTDGDHDVLLVLV